MLQRGIKQLNPSSTDEIHLWWMKSLCDEIAVAMYGGGLDAVNAVIKKKVWNEYFIFHRLSLTFYLI